MLLDELRDLRGTQRTHPVHALGLEHLLDARRGQHATVAHPGQALDAETLLELGHLRGHGSRVSRVALEHLHGDRAALGGAHQAKDDLRVVALAIARMATSGQLAAAPSQPGGGEVIEHQGGAHQVLARQAPLDGGLRLVQPVQCPVQVIGVALTHAQHAAQRGAGGVVVQLAMGGQLGGRLDHAGDQHGLQQRLQRLGRRAEPVRRAAATRAAQHRCDVAMGQGAFDAEELVGTGYRHAATQQYLQTLEDLRGQARQVGQGALADLAVLAVGLAQEDSGRRVAVGHGLDVHGPRG